MSTENRKKQNRTNNRRYISQACKLISTFLNSLFFELGS